LRAQAPRPEMRGTQEKRDRIEQTLWMGNVLPYLCGVGINLHE
jgi:hypothetical protein